MVRRLSLCLAIFLASSPAIAGPHSFCADAVKVTEAGHWSPNRYGADTRQHCARFRPSDAEVKRWFKRARVVTKSYWLEQTEWTQCSATGTALSRGQAYTWFLDQSGRGSVSPPRKEDVYLSGPELAFRPN